MNRKNRILLIILIIIFSSSGIFAQTDYSWWNNTQQWNGVSSWTNYMIRSPYYMGPNALSIPFSEKGRVGEKVTFRFYGDYYYQKGDNTTDIGGRLVVPVSKGKVAIEAWGTLFEYYKMGEDVAIERRARHRYPSGFAIGDAYFATVVQLIRNKKFPDMALRIGLRTASGNHLDDARYTDTPGYFFDLSFGQDFMKNQKQSLSWNAMIGFYSWQMSVPEYQQDDAVLFGAGLDYSFYNTMLSVSVAGYSGYFGNQSVIIINKNKPVAFRDRPVVLRMNAQHQFGNYLFGIRLQAGIHDFLYKSVRIWCQIPVLK